MRDPIADAQGPRQARGWVKRALFVSLAFNLLVVGIVVGGLVREGPARRGSAAEAFPYFRALTEDQRDDLRQLIREEIRGRGPVDGDTAPNRDAPLAGYREAVDVLRADPYDPDRLAAILDAQAARSSVRRVRAQAVLLDYLSTLPSEERRSYADRLAAGIERFPGR